MSGNFYQLLDVPQNATQEEITKSYRKLACKLHPDAVGNDSTVEEFKKISEAYETLSDPSKRAIYNSKLPRTSKKIKPQKTKNRWYNSTTGKWEVNYSHDPNLGNIITPPPPKFDVWGEPINKPKEQTFRDSATYYNGENPYIR